MVLERPAREGESPVHENNRQQQDPEYRETRETLREVGGTLFSKNFKNITRNHSYEWVKVPVGVAYGSNVEEVRQILIKAVNNLEEKAPDGRDIIDTTRPVSVVFDEFGDNSVNLFVTYWVLVEEKFTKTGQVKEAIYNTLNEHNIEIPFPQRDVHIIAQ